MQALKDREITSWEKILILLDVPADFPPFSKLGYNEEENVPFRPAHACLLVVDKPRLSMRLYDANNSHHNSRTELPHLKCFYELGVALVKAFKEYLDLDFTFEAIEGPSKCKASANKKVQQASNNNDCGVFCIFFARFELYEFSKVALANLKKRVLNLENITPPPNTSTNVSIFTETFQNVNIRSPNSTTNGSFIGEAFQSTSVNSHNSINPNTNNGSLFAETIQNANVTSANPDLIFFNRVPKVGSTMMINLIRRLSFRNGVAFFQDAAHPGMQARLNCAQEADLAHLLCQLPKQSPSVYTKHVAMVNFARGGGGCDHVVYINMVRDPVERMISWITTCGWEGLETLSLDFSSCVLQNDDECRFEGAHENVWSQMMFFCGMDERCNEKNGAWALSRAMENVDKYYSVVGVLEELDLSLEVFEAYIPRVFAGARETYLKNKETMVSINKNQEKPNIPEEVKQLVRDEMGNEVRFYEFCKQRLHRQAKFAKLVVT
ncbi:heparan sulfate 2-O-sulfotransferase pipe-like [Folsomia candida]|uniref:heparan sulfate 2-O-sulfotransferase pipe-like n=1 Tax=Folsomia candida TaxID=158441 RepID=UPI001604FFE0|nr:heparan sulfate 2-O-sulfotransferase pipe-like [Folsomia candida]